VQVHTPVVVAPVSRPIHLDPVAQEN
jgi:hypothetical protein